MNHAELGLVYNALREHRTIHTFALKGRLRATEEVEAARILERNSASLADLDEFLRTQGLRLVVLEAAECGYDADGRVYVGLRDPVVAAPSHLGLSSLKAVLADSRRRTEAPRVPAVWGGMFYLLLLRMFYTDEGRGIEEIRRHRDPLIYEDFFAEEAKRFVEQLRSSPPTTDTAGPIIRDVLTTASEAQLTQRAKGFLKALKTYGVIDEVTTSSPVDGVQTRSFAQSLWSAVDVAENLKRHAGTLATPLSATQVAAFLVDADPAHPSEEPPISPAETRAPEGDPPANSEA